MLPTLSVISMDGSIHFIDLHFPLLLHACIYIFIFLVLHCDLHGRIT